MMSNFYLPTASNQLFTSPAAASSQQVPSFPLQATSSTSEADIEASGNDNAAQLNSTRIGRLAIALVRESVFSTDTWP